MPILLLFSALLLWYAAASPGDWFHKASLVIVATMPPMLWWLGVE